MLPARRESSAISSRGEVGVGYEGADMVCGLSVGSGLAFLEGVVVGRRSVCELA